MMGIPSTEITNSQPLMMLNGYNNIATTKFTITAVVNAEMKLYPLNVKDNNITTNIAIMIKAPII